VSSSPTDIKNTSVAVVSMPQMGISVSEGTILEWRKSVGDPVEADETICDVTTDKVDVEIPCPASGVLARIVAEPGETVPVGEPIAEINTGEGEAAAAADEPATGADTPQNGAQAQPEGDRSGFISPVVRRMASEHDVDLSRVEGHGVGGRIRKKDLAAHIETREEKPSRPLHTESPYVPDVPSAPAPAPAPAANGGPGLREPMSPMRKSIADHMVRSVQTAAHCTTIVEVDFSAVAKRRAELKPSYREKGVPLTYLAFVAQAVVESLGQFPALNSSVDGDEIVRHPDVNLGIAVSLDDGLIVPVIPKAQRLSLEGMAAAIADVAGRAREGKLSPDEVQGGTFTITNPGQFGAVLATPIINQPQVAILDLEAIVKRPVVISTVAPTDAERSSRGDVSEDSIAIRPMGYLPMSWDHRALDGAEAARFLGTVKARLEEAVV
jgi:pyruvate/2-oxoglutarate dehydrogenase complex dihydrolipoamide acyltransferase (E2) component